VEKLEIMKKASQYKSIAWLFLAVSMFLMSLPLSAQLMLAHEGHHDAGGCKIETGDFPVTVSVYEVPEGDLPPMHSFCKHVPNAGKINMTIEIADLDTREIPMAVRVVMDGHEEGDHEVHEVHYMPPEQPLSGIIVVVTELEHLGQYTVLLETEDSAGNVKTAVRIPLHVGGGDHGGHGSGFGMLELIFIIAAAGGLAFFFMRKKNTEKDLTKESQG